MNQILDTYLTKINLTKFKIRFFEKILRFLKIKTILTIDSVRRYGELVAAAKNLKIPVLAFQHGQFTKYQTGWLDMTGHRENIIHPDKLLVWADYWKNELLRLGTYYDNQEIDFCENTKSDFLFSQVNIEKPTQKNVLMVFETDAPKDLAQRYIQKIIDCPETKLFFKPRPDRDLNEQLKIYGLDKVRSDLEIITDLAKELDKINIVFGFQSTMLYEMIVEKKAVGVLDSDLDYTEGLILAGFAEKIGLDNICPALHTLGGKGEDELKKLSDKFVGENIKTISNILHSYV